jgi:hypothetical protein
MRTPVFTLALLAGFSPIHAQAPSAAESVPQSVAELWADFDPRRDPIETEVIREWKEDGAVLRHVRYFIGSFKGRPARMAAVYGFPEGTKEKIPAVMHIHGGGQRGSVSEVKLLVARGYAALSVNWGGSGTGKAPFNTCEKAEAGDPNTDWGAVDPTQLNAGRYSSILPGPMQLFEDREHPKNNNWYLLTLGCRRGLTFLEQQPEVDGKRLGVHGYSMGGNLTMYVAGSDDRVKAAVPAVGGAGWRWQPHSFIGGSAVEDHVQGDVELFRRTLSFESYSPRIQCPVLHRSSTNDFHGWMDDVYRTNALIEKQSVRYSWTPHMNHRLMPEVAITMPLWFDHHLQGGPALPETCLSELTLTPEPALRVTTDGKTLPVARVEIYYSVDPDPRARFWRSAEVTRDADGHIARLPIHAHDLPLFAFANVYHTLPKPESLAQVPGYARPVTEVCLSSLFHTRSAAEVRQASPALKAKPSKLIDDFSHGIRDWYVLNAGNAAHQQLWTRKVTDPLWRGPEGARLRITLKLQQANRLHIVLLQNEWRSHRGPRRTFVCQREIPGSNAPQTISLSLSDFNSAEGAPTTWSEIDQLGLCAQDVTRGAAASEAPPWGGPPPEFLRVAWE